MSFVNGPSVVCCVVVHVRVLQFAAITRTYTLKLMQINTNTHEQKRKREIHRTKFLVVDVCLCVVAGVRVCISGWYSCYACACMRLCEYVSCVHVYVWFHCALERTHTHRPTTHTTGGKSHFNHDFISCFFFSSFLFF